MGKYTKKSPKFFKNIREINGFKERRCTQCKEWFPETTEYFYMRNKSKPEKGFNPECKKCSSKRSRKWAINHWDIMKECFKRNHKNPERKAKEKERKKIAKEAGYFTEYRRKNKDKMNEYGRKKRQNNVHKISAKEWNSCKEYFNNECAYCGLLLSEHYYTRLGVTKLGDFHKEHVIHNGANDLSNCVPSCGSCNSSKRNYFFEDWYNENNLNYTEERYNKIKKWLQEDYLKYIKEKKK